MNPETVRSWSHYRLAKVAATRGEMYRVVMACAAFYAVIGTAFAATH